MHGHLNVKFVFEFSLQLLFETVHIIGSSEQDTIQNVYWSSCKMKWSEGCVSLLEAIQIIRSLLLLSYICGGSILYHCIYGCMFCMLPFNF